MDTITDQSLRGQLPACQTVPTTGHVKAPARAGILARISEDPDELARGVARQETDCRELAARLGWGIAGVYVENDTSAYRRRRIALPDGSVGLRVIRPEFRRLLDDLAAGALDGLVAYDLDRVCRDPRDLEDLIDVVEQHRIPVRSVTGSLDLSNDASITMARVMVAVANKSSRDTSRRVARGLDDLARRGDAAPGGIRPFGYRRDGVTVDDAEAAVIRSAAERIIAGERVSTIVNELNAAGVPTVRGGPWSDRSLRTVLVKARNAGLREHRGQIVGPATWPAILDRGTWEQLVEELASRHRSAPAARYWLSGVLRCDGCKIGLTGHTAAGGRGRYRCQPRAGGCGMTIAARHVEDLVGRLIVAHLSRPTVAAGLEQPPPGGPAGVDEDEEQLRELARAWARREITMGEWIEARRVVEARIKATRRAARRLPSSAGAVAASPDAWTELEPAGRRALARALFETIPVRPGTAARFDPARVGPPAWR